MVGKQVNIDADKTGKYVKILDEVVTESNKCRVTGYLVADSKGKDVQVILPGDIVKIKKGDMKDLIIDEEEEEE